jgi:hypothetical protein
VRALPTAQAMPEAMEIETPAKPAVPEKPPPDPAALYRADCKLMASSVDRFVSVREARFATAALRLMAVLRNTGRSSPAATGPVLAAVISASFSPSHPLRERLLAALPPPAADPEPTAAADKPAEGAAEPKKRALLPEMDLLLDTLVLLFLIDGAPRHTLPAPCRALSQTRPIHRARHWPAHPRPELNVLSRQSS